MPEPNAAVTVFLFTDIEGSTRLWDREPERMHEALARHDEIASACVAAQRGRVVKSTGDGIHAAFDDPRGAIDAALALLLALADATATAGIPLRVRCGLHAGAESFRNDDFFGPAVNRAARLMDAAHGGQVLVSQAVAALVEGRLPRRVSLVDLGTVRLRDLTQPERVFQVLHPDLQQQFPALRSLEATPNNLPQSLTSFIGREHEIAQVRWQLTQARLVTIFGIGGLGKSRLSVQVALASLEDFPDGAWFVELASISDPRFVPQAVASALGFKAEPEEPVLEAVARFARDRKVLIVLDNCEHLTQACAELARAVLESAGRARILATSRERLGIAGERTFPLAPFAAPAPRQRLSTDGLAQFASVRLFVERAAAARPDFHVSASNAGAIAEICRRLDGIPLAIELAASRVRSIPVDSIAERLTDRFKLLASGDRTAVPRQQTLRALIDWSFDLLDVPERAMFERLAVFAGGFTLDAAEAIGAGDADPIDLLAGLVEKSLVILDVGDHRYRMLETVREYARERLEASIDLEPTRDRHLAYFLAFAEQAAPKLLGPDQGEWMHRIDVELENLLAAHRWCDHAAAGGELGLRLVRSIQVYWFTRGILALGLQVALEALARPGAQAHNLLRCRSLSGAGQLALYMARYAEARRYLEESLAIAREIKDASRVSAVLQPLGMASLGEGDYATARDRLLEALSIAEASGNKREIAAAMSALTQLRRVEGALDAAHALNVRALELSRELGDRESILVGLLNLAMLAIARDVPRDARRDLLQAMDIAEEIDSKPGGQCAIDVCAALAAHVGDWPRRRAWAPSRARRR